MREVKSLNRAGILGRVEWDFGVVECFGFGILSVDEGFVYIIYFSFGFV